MILPTDLGYLALALHVECLQCPVQCCNVSAPYMNSDLVGCCEGFWPVPQGAHYLCRMKIKKGPTGLSRYMLKMAVKNHTCSMSLLLYKEVILLQGDRMIL